MLCVAGSQKVWLGRRVDDPEQAVFIILWETADCLKKFQDSPAANELLQALPENNNRNSFASGKLGNAFDTLWSPTSLRCPSFRWLFNHLFEERLQGRVTLTTFAIPDTDDPENESSTNSLNSTFRQFVPNDCEGLPVQEKVARMQSWTAWATLDAEGSWVDNQLPRQGHQVAPTGKQSVHTIECEFRHWDGYGGTTQEREETSARSPEARESWTQAVAKVVPSVTALEQER
ncbi:hypothetical protein SCUP234_11339 [Seiridium cupressi]